MNSVRVSARRKFDLTHQILKSPKRAFRVQHSQRSPPVQPRDSPAADPLGVLNAQARASQTLPPPRRSLVGRLLRNLFFAGVFGATGFATLWAWKTYKYLYVGQTLGLPAARMRSKEYFAAKIERSTLVQSLRKDGWIEDKPLGEESNPEDRTATIHKERQGRHLVHEKLTESGNIVTKHFRHPTDGMTVLVFMADFACESWPNTLHGGIATTVIQEALDTHMKNFSEYTSIRHRKTAMNYRLPLRPGVVYSVLIRTDMVEYPYESSKQIDKSLMGVGANVLLNQMDRAPRYVEQYNETIKSNVRVCKIHDTDKGASAYVRGGSTLLLATNQFRELVAQNQQMIPVLEEKLDAWSKTYEYTKPKATKGG